MRRPPPPPGLRALAAAGCCCCCCCWGFSDMVRGPYTGPHAGRGQPGAGRAEETPERGGDARAPSGEARVGAAGGAPGPARGRRRTTKGRGGPPKPRSRREPGRGAPPPLPLLPKQSEAQGGERCPEGGGPGPGGGGAAEGYGVGAPPLPPPRRAGRGSERRPGHLAAAKRRGSMAAAGPRGAAAAERIGGRAHRGAAWRRRVGAEVRNGDSLPEVGRVGRKQNVRRHRGREGHVRSGRRAEPRSLGSVEGPAPAGPARIRPLRGGSALRRGSVYVRLQGRPSVEIPNAVVLGAPHPRSVHRS